MSGTRRTFRRHTPQGTTDFPHTKKATAIIEKHINHSETAMKFHHQFRLPLFAVLAFSAGITATADKRPKDCLDATARRILTMRHSATPAAEVRGTVCTDDGPVLQGFFSNPRNIVPAKAANNAAHQPAKEGDLPFALYTFPQGAPGFAILSVDDRLPAVVAYSLTDKFASDHVPEAMAKIFDTYNEFLQSGMELPARTSEGTDGDDGETEVAGVEPLLQDIAYDQSTPYNLLCPDYNGNLCVTGCVATAMAQVMKYYRYPERMSGDNISYTTSTLGLNVEWDCENTVFDWDNIRDAYGAYHEEGDAIDNTYTDSRYVFSDIGTSESYPQYLEIHRFINISNINPYTDLTFLLTDDAGNAICQGGSTYNINELYLYAFYSTLYLFPSVPGYLPDGSYRLYLATRDLDEKDTWGIVQIAEDAMTNPFGSARKDYYLEVTKTGSTFTILGKKFACGYNYTEASAVANLMAAAGASVEMDYSPQSSGASSAGIARAIRQHFGYDPEIIYVNDTYYTPESWNAAIQHDLRQGHPILCAGQSVENYGHLFVMDGYTMAEGEGEEEEATPYYHLNWGWSGNCNGYFLLDHFLPSEGGTGGFAVNYSYFLNLIMGIHPDDGQEDGVVFGATSVETSANEVAVNGYLYINAVRVTNCCTTDFTGDIKVYAVQEDQEYLIGNLLSHINLPSRYFYEKLGNNMKIPANIPSGNYTIELRTEGIQGKPAPILCPTRPTVYIENGTSTAIDNVETGTADGESARYDLHGRRTNTATGGLTISRQGVEMR